MVTEAERLTPDPALTFRKPYWWAHNPDYSLQGFPVSGMKQRRGHAFPLSLHTEEQWVLGATEEGDRNDSVNDSPPGCTGDWGPVLSTRKISALEETEWHLLQDFNPNLKSGSTDFSHSAHLHFLRPPPHVNMQKHGWHSVPTPCLAWRETNQHQKLDDSRDSYTRYKSKRV